MPISTTPTVEYPAPMPLFAGYLGNIGRAATLARIASAVLVLALVVLTFLAVVLFGPVSS